MGLMHKDVNCQSTYLIVIGQLWRINQLWWCQFFIQDFINTLSDEVVRNSPVIPRLPPSSQFGFSTTKRDNNKLEDSS